MSNKNLLQRAFKGSVAECAGDLGISDKRLYEILSKDDPYERTWRLLRSLAMRNPEGLRMVADDFNLRMAGLIESVSGEINVRLIIGALLDEAVPDRQRRRVVDALVDLNRYMETHK